MADPSDTLAIDGPVMRNPAWADCRDLIHGVTVREFLPDAGRIPLADATLRLRTARLVGDAPVFGGDQVHGVEVVVVGRAAVDAVRGVGPAGPIDGLAIDTRAGAAEFETTDALVTTERGVVLTIRTADCLPLFLVDRAAGVLGLAHCGWRSTRGDIAGLTVARMTELGASASTIEVWIGPCIRAEAYEVGRELVAEFAAAFPGAPASPEGTHLDLPAIVRWQLERGGLRREAIADAACCTFGGADLCHSYRRDGERAGRMFSMLGWRAGEGSETR